MSKEKLVKQKLASLVERLNLSGDGRVELLAEVCPENLLETLEEQTVFQSEFIKGCQKASGKGKIGRQYRRRFTSSWEKKKR